MGYGYHSWNNWGISPIMSFPYSEGFFFGEEEPKPDKGIAVEDSITNGHFVYQNRNGKSEYLHKDGTWHKSCGEANFYSSKREAEVAAVLAGMESPEAKQLRERLTAKQAFNDSVCRERDNLKACNKNQADQITRLSAEVAKLKGDLAQAEPICGGKLHAAKEIAEGRGCHLFRESESLNAVRKLRADYEAAKRARHYNFSRLESLAAGVVKDGETITDWAAEEIIRLRNHLNACKGIASGDVAVWIGSCAALDAVIKCRHQAVKAENARKALA